MKFYVPAALPLRQEPAVPRRKLTESVWKGTNAVASLGGAKRVSSRRPQIAVFVSLIVTRGREVYEVIVLFCMLYQLTN